MPARARFTSKRRWMVAIPWAAALLVGIGACTTDQAPPNVILISLDTTRADHLSAYGYSRPTSPSLDQLAAEGVLFEQAYSTTSTTGPTQASLLTGLLPPDHRIVRNGLALDERFDSIAEIAGRAGFTTAGIVSSFVMNSKFSLNQGFESWNEDFDSSSASWTPGRWNGHRVPNRAFDRRADATTDLATEWLDSSWDGAQPFLLFLHYFDPHAPYDPPAEFAELFQKEGASEEESVIDRYDAEIAFLDHELGRLFDVVRTDPRLRDDTLLVVTADHGEGLGQHGYDRHGANIHEEAVRVPMIMWWPGRIPAGKRSPAPVSVVDVVPTMAGWMGLDVPAALPGADLGPFVEGEGSLPSDRPIWLYRRYYESAQARGIPVSGYQLGLRQAHWKLIFGPDEGRLELFDLTADPGELVNLVDEQPAQVNRMLASLDTLRRQADDVAEGTPIDSADASRLRALGYVR